MKVVLDQKAYLHVLHRPSFETLLVSVFNQPFAERCKYFRGPHVDKSAASGGITNTLPSFCTNC
jgi:hypothetical protein